MAQRIKAVATKPENLGSIPGTHIVKGENYLLQVSPLTAQVQVPQTTKIINIKRHCK